MRPLLKYRLCRTSSYFASPFRQITTWCFCLLLMFPIFQSVQAQDKMLDSLYTVLNTYPNQDTLRVNLLISICYKEYTSNPEKNRIHATEALQISTAIKFRKGVCLSHRYLALYAWSKGDYDNATQEAFEMLRLAEAMNYTTAIGTANQLLGLLSESQGKFEKAETYYLQALEIYKKANAKRSIGYAYNSLGSLSLNFEKFDTAMSYFLKSMEIRQQINDGDGLSQTYSNIAHAYMGKHMYEQALAYFQRAIPLQEKLNNQFRLAGTFAGMGEMYILMNDFGQAESYLQKSVSIAKGLRQKKLLQEILEQLSTLEKKRRHYDQALAYFELAAQYKDSIFSEDREKKITEAEARYDTEKKTNIINLLERDKKIRTLWNDILVAVLVLTISLSLVVYYVQHNTAIKNRHILNLEIDRLTTEHHELTEKQRNILPVGDEKVMDSYDQRLLRKAIEVVEQNMNNPAFSVDDLAKELNMSRTNLHRKIKATTAFPPGELIRSIRLRKAAMLLLNRTDSISQISIAVGFDDHSYFSKAFKKHFGVSPSEYQAQTVTIE
jgi:AraC-like DNA-binding protein/tetratricopeptide (TPR) repeat protein